MEVIFLRVYLPFVFLLVFPLLGFSQIEGNAQASSQGPVRATVGTFVFSRGERIALELLREEPCPCLCGPWEVRAFYVEDSSGGEVFRDDAPYPVPANRWLGTWDFRDEAGQALPPGAYTLIVETSFGRFQVRVRLVEERHPHGYSLATASVCGIEVLVYRLFTQEQNGAAVSLWKGERIMILLPGNPTTGYQWDATKEPGILERLREPEYRPEGKVPGAGGIFLFRYRARESGEGTLTLVYRRPWEGTPAETFSLRVKVRGFTWDT